MEKKEITKGRYKLMVWGTLMGGIIINTIFYTLINLKYPNYPLQLVGFLSFACILIGVGIGLSLARNWKIIGVD